MKVCNNCGNKNLMVSKKESSIIKGAKYVACTGENGCGNIMLLINGILAPTPTDNNGVLMLDATECFHSLVNIDSIESLEKEAALADIHTIEQAQTYIEKQIELQLKKGILISEDELINSCDENCDECFEGCSDFEKRKAEAIANDQPVYLETKTVSASIDSMEPTEEIQISEVKPVGNYLLLLSNGEKQVYMGTSKDFMINIINNIGSQDFALFELKHIELKQEVKYSF